MRTALVGGGGEIQPRMRWMRVGTNTFAWQRSSLAHPGARRGTPLADKADQDLDELMSEDIDEGVIKAVRALYNQWCTRRGMHRAQGTDLLEKDGAKFQSAKDVVN